MKTEQEINFNYDNAMKQVAELNEIASSLKKVGSTNLSDCMKKVGKNWKGENATAYVKKGDALNQKITKCAKSISETAKALSTMAENIYHTEKANIATIQEK